MGTRAWPIRSSASLVVFSLSKVVEDLDPNLRLLYIGRADRHEGKNSKLSVAGFEGL
jgi:hypothetical protein